MHWGLGNKTNPEAFGTTCDTQGPPRPGSAMPSRSTSAIHRYLERWGAPELQQISASVSAPFDVDLIVVIPACCESRLLPGTLESLHPRWLGIVVINSRDNADDAVHRENAELLTSLRSQLVSPQVSGVAVSGLRGGTHPLILVDQTSPDRRLPAHGGVGDARKLGCDLAARIADTQGVPWIFSTDADARLSQTLGDALTALPAETLAASWPYAHTWDGEASEQATEALALYELSLRHYTAGLQRAGSPYAFPTLGSAIAFRPSAYAAVRGFPKRQAGEDFYLLNKLSKLGGLTVPDADPVAIVGRPSDRVPFGTGPAMARIADAGLGAEFKVYDPRSFDVVAAMQHAIGHVSRTDGPTELAAAISSSVTLPLSEDARARLDACLIAITATWSKGLNHMQRQGRTQAMRSQQLQTYLDAFRTLKLIHAVRDEVFPLVPWREGLNIGPETSARDALETMRRSTVLGYTVGL